MDSATFYILLVILTAYIFDFINGFHDAANSIATIVSTGVLTPAQAVAWAAFFNFIAFMFFSLMVAKTIGHDLVNPSVISTDFIFAALIGAIVWNLITWYYGLPSSSSHALIGGMAGAGIYTGGFSVLKASGFIKVGLGIVLSPLVGFLASFLLTVVMGFLLKRFSEEKLNNTFKGFQLASSALLSLTHGGNDAQKTMGIIAVLLFSANWLGDTFYVPFWVVISCHAVISLGTLAGGWRIVHTMGTKITTLNTFTGCTAETGAAAIIYACTEYGVPVSTTQTVTGSITGVGLANGWHQTHWPILRKIFLAWVLTIPAAGLVAAFLFMMMSWFH